MSEGCSDIQEKARENTVLVSGEKGIQQALALCDKKEEGKDYVYAVVHKERKGGASSGASTLKKSSDHPQEGTGLPVNRRSCVDCNDRSSHPTDLGLDKNTEAAESEIPQAGGNSEYLYAAVDKTKKKKPPQVIYFTNPENFRPFLLLLLLLLLLLFFIYIFFFASVLFNLGKKSWYIHPFDSKYKPMTVKRAAEIRQVDLLLSI